MSSFGPVWVIAEQSECAAEIVSLQLVGKARQLAEQLGVNCESVLLGSNLGGAVRDLLASGADRVYLADDPRLELYQPALYSEIICMLAEKWKPEIILMGSTFMGRELAPLVAARLRTGLAAHCTGLRLDRDNRLEQLIPAYGGLMSIVCPEKRPQMATVARGVFATPARDAQRKGEIVAVPVPEMGEPTVRTLEIVREPVSDGQLEDARVIVSGGAGAGSAEGWEAVRELCRELGAGLACTRPAVDAGWAPLESMIGQSGKMVSPEVYIGVGVSGEQQHMVGVVGAKLMIAVNNDPKSPVFEQVDLGVAEDCREFLPVLASKIRAYRESRKACV
ncbi:MAG: electron transfer flavoprotein subunit alpha/FixB family protein [Desulfobacteraceae bacterium]|nr:electron transfer flavoprotein subunit alpha/FixB family protein [Desulfobacteraceae bacterium]